MSQEIRGDVRRVKSVLIAGGGIGALEAVLSLRAMPGGKDFDLTLVSASNRFNYRPALVGRVFGMIESTEYDLHAICADLNVNLRIGQVVEVDGEQSRVRLADDSVLDFEALIVAVGAKATPPLSGALTLFTSGGSGEFEDILNELEEGALDSIAFVVPAATGWTLPLYELALMTAHRAEALGRRQNLAIMLITPEEVPLAAFRGAGSDAVTALLSEAGITVKLGAYVHDLEGSKLTLSPGDLHLNAEQVVALPRLVGPRLRGLPTDADGFVFADEFGRVAHMSGVFAIGDAKSFPIKHGGIAAQQADVVARLLAGAAADEKVLEFDRPHLEAALSTGDEPLYLTASITGGESVTSTASYECPWSPPDKIAAVRLGPYLTSQEGVSATLTTPSRWFPKSS